jgi:Rrf2 family cysteine metabolism transcriptional repressor
VRLSTKGRYGVRAMFVLAQHFGQGPLPLKQIAEEQNLSEAYLEQLLAELRKANLLESVRGAQGGYLLAREPENITVGDIIRVMEGPIGPAQCVTGDEDACSQAERCVTHLIWTRIRDCLNEELDSISLLDMLNDAEQIAGGALQCEPTTIK